MADPSLGFKLAQQGVQFSNATVNNSYKFPAKSSIDPLLGYKLAQQGVNLSRKKSYRYPLAALDSTYGGSDYLEIKILEYVEPGFGSAPGTLRLPSAGDPKSATSIKNPLYYILLPIPQNLSDSNNVDWGDSSIDPFTGYGVKGVTDLIGSSSLIKEGKTQIQNLINTTIGTIKTGAGQDLTQAAIGSAIVGSLGSNVSANSILSRATGQVINPNLELLFNGVTLRNFQFSFEFAPRSPEEGEEVKQIIRLFKKHMSAKSNATAGNGLLIKSPEVFQLSFKSGSSDHPFLFKMKPTALTNIDVNYNASGPYSTYSDGTPVHMSMNLIFKELSPIYSEDYDSVPSGVGY